MMIFYLVLIVAQLTSTRWPNFIFFFFFFSPPIEIHMFKFNFHAIKWFWCHSNCHVIFGYWQVHKITMWELCKATFCMKQSEKLWDTVKKRSTYEGQTEKYWTLQARCLLVPYVQFGLLSFCIGLLIIIPFSVLFCFSLVDVIIYKMLNVIVLFYFFVVFLCDILWCDNYLNQNTHARARKTAKSTHG